MSHSSPRCRVSIATYNVRRCIGTDGVCDVSRIGRVLAEIDADVVALQELSFRDAPHGIDQLSRLADMCGYHSARCIGHQTTEGALGLGLMSREAPIEVDELDLSFKNYEPRAALSARIELCDTKFRIVTAHLGLRWRERRYQAEILAEELTHRTDEEVRVLLGDLNDWIPGSPNLTALDGPVEKTSWGTATFPSWLPVLSLDEIWVSPGIVVSERRAFRTSVSRRASDHLPLLAELEIASD